MNKIIICLVLGVMFIITAAEWVRFMAEYEEFIGLEEELRFYGPMMK